MRGASKCLFGQQIVPAFYDSSAAAQNPVFVCVSPARLTVAWVQIELSLDGQSFTKASRTKYNYYGEYDVLSAAPNGGPVDGGTIITVIGVGFIMSEYLTCFFGTGQSSCDASLRYPCYTASAAVFVSTSLLTCFSPAMPTGGDISFRYPISVGLNGQFSQSCPNQNPTFFCTPKDSLFFSYYRNVFVSRVLPNSGRVDGGTPITVTGSNFRTDRFVTTVCLFTLCNPNEVYLSGSAYKVRGQSCSGKTVQSAASAVISDTVIVCKSPVAASADSYLSLIDVSLNGGLSAQGLYGPVCPDGCPVLFAFYSMPSLATAFPSLGSLLGGAIITVSGSGFVGIRNTPIRCLFGGLERLGANSTASYISISLVSCVAPSQLVQGIVKIQISLNGMDNDFTLVSNGASFLYHDFPSLSGLPIPSAGPSDGRTVITLFGIGFLQGVPQCKFYLTPSDHSELSLCSNPASCITPATILSSSMSMCRTPQVVISSRVSISLALNGQEFTPFDLKNMFFFYLQPSINTIHPSSGPAESWGYITLFGSNFQNTAHIQCSTVVMHNAGVFISSSLVTCQTAPVQLQVASVSLLKTGLVEPISLPLSWTPSPIQSYPLEVSFDGQIYTADRILYTYYKSPRVVAITPSYASKTDGTAIAVLTGFDFRNDLGGPICKFGNKETVTAVFVSAQNILCQVPVLDTGQQVIVAISLNGQDYETHKSQIFIFFGEAPVLQRAVFNFQHASIEVSFDVDTDRGGMSGAFDCGYLLQNPVGSNTSLSGVNLSAEWISTVYGFGAFCSFSSNLTLSIQLGVRPSVTLGQVISLYPTKVMRGNEMTYFAAGSVEISGGKSIIPTIVSSYNAQIGKCDDVIIDAGASVGGGGRPLTYKWSFSNDPKQITDDTYTQSQKASYLSQITSLVNEFSVKDAGIYPFHACAHPYCLTCLTYGTRGECLVQSNDSWTNCDCSELKVPFQQFPVGNYQFLLTVKNWLGFESFPVIFSVQKMLQPVILVSIHGQTSGVTRMLSSNKSISFASDIKVPRQCQLNENSQMIIKWAVTNARTGDILVFPSSFSDSAQSYTLPPHMLQPGFSYLVSIDVVVAVDSSSSLSQSECACPRGFIKGFSSEEVETVLSSPVAVIRGGDRLYGVTQDLQLDGTSSWNPDLAPEYQSAAAMNYHWSCLLVFSNGNESLCESFGVGSDAELPISAWSVNAKSINQTKYILITLKVSTSLIREMYGETSIKLFPVVRNTPDILVSTVKNRYSASERIVLLSDINLQADVIFYKWSTESGDVDISLSQNILSSNNKQKALTVKPNTLTSGSTYTFRLTATVLDNVGWGQTTITINNPPSQGELFVSPQTGIALDTLFQISYSGWQDAELDLPIQYQIEYFEPTKLVNEGFESPQYFVLSPFKQTSNQQWYFPTSTNRSNNSWAIILRVRDSIGGEITYRNCNEVTFLCRIQVLSNFSGVTGAIEKLRTLQISDLVESIVSKDVLRALSKALIILATLNNQQQTLIIQRRRAVITVSAQALIDFRCKTVAPLLNQSIPDNLLIQPEVELMINSTAQSLNALFAIPSQVDVNCINILESILSRIFSFVFFEFQINHQVLDKHMLQLVKTALDNAISTILLLTDEVAISDLKWHLDEVLKYHRLVSALSVLGTEVGENQQTLNGLTTFSVAARLECKTSASGFTTVPPFVSSFPELKVIMPMNTIELKIGNLPCARSPAGELTCQPVASVVASVDLLDQNPFFIYSRQSSVISAIAWPKLMVYGTQDMISMVNLVNSTVMNFMLLYDPAVPSKQLIPNAARNSYGQFRIAACVQWNGTTWSTDFCVQTKQYSFLGITWVECSCNRTSLHAVVDALAGCDGIPFSSLILDVCKICGGDNSSCRGCDGLVASGKVLDRCNICGGDNSSCAGCDGIPNSGAVFDFCGVCNGDQSTCSGCDGIPIHPNTQVRMKILPKQFDACGVCGGCNASCSGCDGLANSHRELDLCQRCGPFNTPNDDQYQLSTINNCTAGMQPCSLFGQAKDACGVCVGVQDTASMNKQCIGCDNIPRLYGRKSVDKCGICGGNDCSCKDCFNVTNGLARLDRCGVCNGNNTCLDCFGVPYGTARLDVCNICNGRNTSSQCRGCDDKLYPRPKTVPIFDAQFICCLGKIGCNNLCNASIGCDGKCNSNPLKLDNCGVCGGTNLPNTGTCDCTGTTPYINMSAAVGCDGVCKYNPTAVDTCGVCGGNNLPNTGQCDCDGVPRGSALVDKANLCCKVEDMGCDSLCFSGKTYDECGECGGDGSVCSINGRASVARSLIQGPCTKGSAWRMVVTSCMIMVLLLQV
uniref:IPT/TIG domain-containing protein n=1 Tax=Cryptomonas curvata TaxID=233186 RepID=A0A7S0QIJ2_9CRYP